MEKILQNDYLEKETSFLDKIRNHPLSTYAKFSKKLTFLTPICVRMCVYQGVRNVSCLKNFTYELNG